MNVAEWEMLARNNPCRELKDQQGNSTGGWLTCVARISFVKFPDESGKYTCVLIFPPNGDLAPLFECARRAAVDKWGERCASMNLRSPFKNQSEMAAQGYGGFANEGYFVNLSSKNAPKFFAADGRSQLTLSPDLIWSGCYVIACINGYTYDKDKEGKPIKPGVGLGLRWLQFVTAGEKLGGGLDPTEYLQPIVGLPATAAPAPAPAAASMFAPAPAAAAPAAPMKPIAGALF